jgi:hypothetical protein
METRATLQLQLVPVVSDREKSRQHTGQKRELENASASAFPVVRRRGTAGSFKVAKKIPTLVIF